MNKLKGGSSTVGILLWIVPFILNKLFSVNRVNNFVSVYFVNERGAGMIQWMIGTVKECNETRTGVQEISVEMPNGDMAKAVHYTDVLSQVYLGDIVQLNTTAVELSLGTGGVHFVYSILKRSGVENSTTDSIHRHNGHMMKLRYTPQQRSVLAAEEENSPYHSIFTQYQSLEGTPVLIGELHSMLPIVMCWLNYLKKRAAECGNLSPDYPKTAYVMSDGGALPLSYSKHIATIKDLGWLSGTVTYGQAYGGNIETMNKFTALIAAKYILKADLIIVLMGPGIAGTATLLGHTGVEVGELVNAVSSLDGKPIVIPRISFVDKRERHQGLSHHTLSSLRYIAINSAVLPLPAGLSMDKKNILLKQLQLSGCDGKHEINWVPSIDLNAIQQSQQLYPYSITTMGRELSEDPDFFLGVCSAAEFACQHGSHSSPV